MKAAERVWRAIHYQKPDRIPFIGYNGLSPVCSDILPLTPLTPNSWQPQVDGLFPHVHIMQLQFGLYRWKAQGWKKKPFPSYKKWKFTRHKEIDEWGVIWEDAGDGTMGWPVEGPLTGWDLLDKLEIPNGNDSDRYKLIRNLARFVPKKSKFRMGLMDNFLFERSHFLRGWDRYLRDLVKSPDQVKALLWKIMPYYEGIINQLKGLGAQAVFTTDDWGSQEDVFISPRLFDKVFLEPYQHITGLCHELGMDFILHSCGNIGKFIPNFIAAGIDALELDSPRMTGWQTLKEYSGKMAYLCCVNIQSVYPNGTPADIENEVREMALKLGAQDGGLVFIDYAGAEFYLHVPKTNISAFSRAARRLGKYSKNGRLEIQPEDV